jgi:hypothetical protein
MIAVFVVHINDSGSMHLLFKQFNTQVFENEHKQETISLDDEKIIQREHKQEMKDNHFPNQM